MDWKEKWNSPQAKSLEKRWWNKWIPLCGLVLYLCLIFMLAWSCSEAINIDLNTELNRILKSITISQFELDENETIRTERNRLQTLLDRINIVSARLFSFGYININDFWINIYVLWYQRFLIDRLFEQFIEDVHSFRSFIDFQFSLVKDCQILVYIDSSLTNTSSKRI